MSKAVPAILGEKMTTTEATVDDVQATQAQQLQLRNVYAYLWLPKLSTHIFEDDFQYSDLSYGESLKLTINSHSPIFGVSSKFECDHYIP